MIKVVDKATGEIIEIDYSSYEEFADKYDGVTQQIKALERAKKQMAVELKYMMGEDDKLELTDGRYFRKFISQYKNYNPEIVVDTLGASYLKADKVKVDQAILDEPEAPWAKELRDSLEPERVVESLRLIKEGHNG